MLYFIFPLIVLLISFFAGCSLFVDDNKHVQLVSAENKRVVLALKTGLSQPKVAKETLDCQSTHDMKVYCGYKNPEDLVLLPNGKHILVSEMAEFLSDAPGNLSLLNLETAEKEFLDIDWSKSATLGGTHCPPPNISAFSPHGIDLVRLSDGTLELLVVNHGHRESIEFFEVIYPDNRLKLLWRGCAIPPGDPFINDVSALKDGGFLATHMWNKATPFDEVVRKLLAGELSGWVYEWQRDSGFSKVSGSDGSMPNGIAVSPDNEKIFVNYYFGNKTVKIDRRTGKREGNFWVQHPDNITVDDQGLLWVASHNNDPIGQTCVLVTEGPCLLPFKIVRADPERMKPEVILFQYGPPMGYATVALKFGDRFFMGSAHGDRVVSSIIKSVE